jgi:membrane associated rhomboid family serine protease
LFLFPTMVEGDDSGSSSSSSGCDEHSISSQIPLNQLIPNQFYKICGKNYNTTTTATMTTRWLSQPKCGDGGEYGFLVSRPVQKYSSQQRVLIEFLGGGACWDATTCQYNQKYLSFPEIMNDFIGLSCSEIQVALRNRGQPIHMLCASDDDALHQLQSYTMIVIPYCTQDVHSGDSQITYEDGNTVYHHGAHNVRAVLQYVFRNIPNPSHVILTGCSAGGTALPLAYHYIHAHYNKMFTRRTHISVMADSPVYLTPTYFLENGMPKWNSNAIVKKIGFPFNKWQYSKDYPTKLWEYILNHGNKHHPWGFVSHTHDPVSVQYFQWMSGSHNNNNQRRLEDNTDVETTWWSQLSSSLEYITSRHANVHTYWIDEAEGHCSFGLYYPLQTDGFAEWAGAILQFPTLSSQDFTAGSFAWCLFLGAGLASGSLYLTERKENRKNDHGSDFIAWEEEDQPELTKRSWKESIRGLGLRFFHTIERYPVTAAYVSVVTTYFLIMILREPFTHPLNNPSIGPSALTLHRYGILNPSYVVYKYEWFRLITSCFLCSGIWTFLMAIGLTAMHVIPLEILLGSKNFGIIAALLGFGSNLIYSFWGNGASCSCTAFMVGFSAFRVTMVRDGISRATIALLLVTALVVSVFFPFNSWILVLSNMVLGVVLAMVLLETTKNAEQSAESNLSEKITATHIKQDHEPVVPPTLRQKRLFVAISSLVILSLLLIIRVRRPDKLYLEPFYTGCDLKYTDAISDLITTSYANDYGDQQTDELDGLCAQFCIPNFVSRVSTVGAKKIFDFDLQSGTCELHGYGQHLIDKTFQYFRYSLDVEIYQANNSDE